MSDAYGCGHDGPALGGESEEHEPDRLGRVELPRFAAISGVPLLAAVTAGRGGTPRVVDLVLQAAVSS